MKKFYLFVVVTVSSFLYSSCKNDSIIGAGECSTVSFDTKSFSMQAASVGLNESAVDSFILDIEDSQGVVYSGPFGHRPETVRVRAGKCSFSLSSRIYAGPEFDNPVYGDSKVVEVAGGDDFEVVLSCRQLTSGVQIIFSQEFRDELPDGFVRLTCRDTLSNEVEAVDYHPSETGFCHFMPGILTVNLMKNAESAPELLTGRYCSESDMFSVTVKMASEEAAGSVGVVVDTILVRYAETYTYGRKREGRSVFDAIDITDLPDFVGDTVWVTGYVSGYFNNKKWHHTADTSAVTANISLSSSLDAGTACPVSISSGKCRSLNLKEHPHFYGERIAVLGIPGKLYDLDGIKKSLDFVVL